MPNPLQASPLDKVIDYRRKKRISAIMEVDTNSDPYREALTSKTDYFPTQNNRLTGIAYPGKLVAELKSQIPDVHKLFKIHRRVGKGKFSTVFLASLRSQQHLPEKRLFALKYLIPTSRLSRIAQELRCLNEI
ncbi:Cell division cycle 7-related protein kinase, partial [Pseudolycoriella hygida]